MYNKKYHDKKISNNRKLYSQGDLVMLRERNISSEIGKMSKKFKGPYQIKKILSKERYVVGDIDGYQISGRNFETISDSKNMRLYSNCCNATYYN